MTKAAARAELAALDARLGADSLLGDQVAAALDLPARTTAEVADHLARERLLRHPVRLAATEFACRLAVVHRRLPAADWRTLVEDLYPAHAATVPELASLAQLAAAGSTIVAGQAVEGFRVAAGRALAVLLVDAMRADVWLRSVTGWSLSCPAGLYSGRAVPAGSGPPSPAELGTPFAHLGVEAAALVGVDAGMPPEALHELWAHGPRLSVAAATGVDQRLHRCADELVALLDEAAAGLQRRVLPTLAWLPDTVPLVVLADHGFRENASWGRGAGAVRPRGCVPGGVCRARGRPQPRRQRVTARTTCATAWRMACGTGLSPPA